MSSTDNDALDLARPQRYSSANELAIEYPGGKNRQVLRTEAKRGDEWVRVNDEPKPVRITSQMVQSGNVLLIFGPPPDMAMLGDDP